MFLRAPSACARLMKVRRGGPAQPQPESSAVIVKASEDDRIAQVLPLGRRDHQIVRFGRMPHQPLPGAHLPLLEHLGEGR